MKKLLLIMLLTFTTMAYADVGKYVMVYTDDEDRRVWVLNTENGDIKQCYWVGSGGKGVVCSSWRKNDEDKFYED